MLAALEIGLKGNKWFSLIDKVWSEGTLELAWEKVKSNAGACGMDGITIGRFAKDSRSRLLAVKEHLKRGTYQPKPVKRVWIPKPGSTEKRPLGIPTVTDRVVQAALRMVIEPIFESRFAEGSHGFRPGRGCKDALRQVEGLLRAGRLHVVDVDIKGYFDTIPHERLMALVRERLADGRVDPLEWEMAGEGFAMARYADDMVVLCRSLEEAQKALAAIKEWMAEAGLALHPEKTRLVDMTTAGSHFDFLGYRFKQSQRGKIIRLARPKSLSKLREAIKPKVRRANGKSMEVIIGEVNRTLQGWFAYFKHIHVSEMKVIDQWVRGRLRSILRKCTGRKGRGRGLDHHRWPNHYFTRLGLFCLQEARELEIASLRYGENY
jgi:RNA-directed DNA polymerase